MKRKNIAKNSGEFALRVVRRFAPGVEKVLDADGPLEVTVTSRDVASAAKKDHAGCAMAVACKREQHADGIIIAMKTAYVIKGKTAVRYAVPESVRREIVSFDRGASFAPGSYKLNKIQPSRKLGSAQGTYKKGGGRKTGSHSKHKHQTEGVRTNIGNKL